MAASSVCQSSVLSTQLSGARISSVFAEFSIYRPISRLAADTKYVNSYQEVTGESQA